MQSACPARQVQHVGITAQSAVREVTHGLKSESTTQFDMHNPDWPTWDVYSTQESTGLSSGDSSLWYGYNIVYASTTSYGHLPKLHC